MTLNTITIPAEQPPAQYGLVVLHGWGANAKDLTTIAPALGFQTTQMMFPDAPFDHPQVSGGKMWYDLQQPDEAGLNHSREALQQWFNALETTTGIPLEQTFLLGFSQGGAMTLDVGFQFPFRGLCCLSGYLHSEPAVTSPAPPTLITHGTQDPVVPITAAQQARDTLQQKGVTVSYHEFAMQHEVTPEVIATVKEFITNLGE